MAAAVDVTGLSSSNGDILFDHDGTLAHQFAGTNTQVGDISITSNGQILASHVSAGTSGTGNLLLETTAAADVFVAYAAAPGDLVTITANGSVQESASDSTADIVANQLLATTTSGFGVGDPIETTVSSAEI